MTENLKEALTQLDGLYAYACSSPDAGEKKKNTLEKKAGLFSHLGRGAKQEMKQLDQHISTLQKQVDQSKAHFDDRSAYLRAAIKGKNPDALNKAIEDAREAEDNLTSNVTSLQEAFATKGVVEAQAARNTQLLSAGIGIPGLAGLSYANENAKDSN